jgi:hypothetical protein
MSAQGGTLARRGTLHLPIVPVAAVLGAAVAVAIGMSTLSGTDGRVITSVTDTERFANSSAAVREQGATLPFEQPVNPGMWTISQAEAYLARLQAIESSTAAVREAGAVGLENPGAYAAQGTSFATGLENPGAYVGGAGVNAGQAVAAPAAPHEPIVVNGRPCHQCI